MFVFIPPSAKRPRPTQKELNPRVGAVVIAVIAAIFGVSRAFRTVNGVGDKTDAVPAMILGATAFAIIVASIVAAIKQQNAKEGADEGTPAVPTAAPQVRHTPSNKGAGPGEESPGSDADDMDIAEEQRPIAFLVFASLTFIGVIVALLLFWSKPASAQGNTVQSAFIIIQGSDTLAVERVVRTGGSVQGDLTARASPRLAYLATITEGINVPLLTFQMYGVGAPADALPLQTGSMRIGSDTAVIEVGAGGAMQRVATPIQGKPLPLINLSMGLLELAIARAKAAPAPYSGQMFLLAGKGVPVGVTVEFIGADSAIATVANVIHRFGIDRDGTIQGGQIPSQKISITRVTGAAAAKISFGRTDYGAPSGAPYTADEVTVRTAAGHSLSGTLTIPKGANGRLPAVITITGSGQEDRDEFIPLVPNYRPFRQLADTLGRRGIAVLRLDDRGINGSGGDVRNATSADFANDIRAGIEFLRARADIDPARIALFGHSEGGMIGPMVAATDSKLAGVVIFAGPAYTGRRILDFQLRNLVMGDSAIPAAKKDSAVKAQVAAWDATSGKAPWVKFFLDYDPLIALKKVKSPVLILQGGTDQQVTPEQAPIIERTLKAAGNKDVTLRVFPNRNHLFLADSVGFPGGYTKLKDGHIGADIMGPLTEWLVQKLAETRPRP